MANRLHRRLMVLGVLAMSVVFTLLPASPAAAADPATCSTYAVSMNLGTAHWTGPKTTKFLVGVRTNCYGSGWANPSSTLAPRICSSAGSGAYGSMSTTCANWTSGFSKHVDQWYSTHYVPVGTSKTVTVYGRGTLWDPPQGWVWQNCSCTRGTPLSKTLNG